MFDFVVITMAMAAILILLPNVLSFHAKNSRLTLARLRNLPVPARIPSQSGRSARAANLLSFVH